MKLHHLTREMYVDRISLEGIQLEGCNRDRLGHEHDPDRLETYRSYRLLGRYVWLSTLPRVGCIDAHINPKDYPLMSGIQRVAVIVDPQGLDIRPWAEVRRGIMKKSVKAKKALAVLERRAHDAGDDPVRHWWVSTAPIPATAIIETVRVV